MYGFPSDFDSAVLVGRTIQLVAFSENTVHLHLSWNCLITADAGSAVVIVVPEAPHLQRVEVVPILESILMRMVGRVVTGVEVVNGCDLCLSLESGYAITIRETSRDYECYHLRIGDEEWHI